VEASCTLLLIILKEFIRKGKKIQEKSELNSLNQVLVYADDVQLLNISGKPTKTTQKLFTGKQKK
jgi:hypothetical protein